MKLLSTFILLLGVFILGGRYQAWAGVNGFCEGINCCQGININVGPQKIYKLKLGGENDYWNWCGCSGINYYFFFWY